jgi:hypothetical protein
MRGRSQSLFDITGLHLHFRTNFTGRSYHRYGEPWTLVVNWMDLLSGALQAFRRSAMIYVSVISIVGVLMGR